MKQHPTTDKEKVPISKPFSTGLLSWGSNVNCASSLTKCCESHTHSYYTPTLSLEAGEKWRGPRRKCSFSTVSRLKIWRARLLLSLTTFISNPLTGGKINPHRYRGEIERNTKKGNDYLLEFLLLWEIFDFRFSLR